ncbi:MAG: hypothetical protein DRR03_07680, partial [Gammaproteobacteria bacterium]
MRYLILALVLLFPLSAQSTESATRDLAERVAVAAFTATEKALIEEFFGKPAEGGTKTDGEASGGARG